MSGKTSIEWMDKTWNPVTGCTKVSPGCKNCYAERITETRFKTPFEEIHQHRDRIEDPLHWRQPAKIFVNSMSDFFHEKIDFTFQVECLRVMQRAHQHTFQILTKRPSNAESTLAKVAADFKELWPLPNVWLGASVESPEYLARFEPLLRTPAAVHFASFEPLLAFLGEFSRAYLNPHRLEGKQFGTKPPLTTENSRNVKLDWVIVGGESGPDARPMQGAWARSIRDQCVRAATPFFFKQWGEFKEVRGQMVRVGKKAAGRLLDGKIWNQFPKP